MKLMTLTLNNFQGVKALTLNFDGESAAIYGDNATGKSTVFNAYAWLLTDAPAKGAKNFTPKTMGPDGELHNLEHSVEGVFDDENGKITTLKKVFSEVWTKKRGRAEAEFSGHTTVFYINGVPGRQSDYDLAVTSLFGNREMTKILTIPHYFAESVKWDVRRKILLEMCGDVSDEDVIAADGDLAGLPVLLEGHTVDEWRKIASAKMKEINKQLDAITGRIDEATHAIPDISGINEGDINIRLTELERGKAALENKRSEIKAAGGLEDIRRRIAEIDTKIAVASAEYAKREIEKNSTALAELSKARTEVQRLTGELKNSEDKAALAKDDIETMRRLRDTMLGEYNTVKSQTWNENEAICPTCGRELPTEKVEQLRSDFQLKKSEKLREINERGKQNCSERMIVDLECVAVDAEAEKARIEAELALARKRAETMEAAIDKPIIFYDTDEYRHLLEQKKALESKLLDADGAKREALTEVEGKIKEIEVEISHQREGLTMLKIAGNQTLRVSELEAEEKSLGKDYLRFEAGVNLCERFVRTKVAMLTDKINDHFKNVRFRLYKEQINGGIADDCEVVIPSEAGNMVPYSTANDAARINAGLEIISSLGEHWGSKLPVFVDNAESVTHLAEIDTQVIRLVVSAKDKTLRMEEQP